MKAKAQGNDVSIKWILFKENKMDFESLTNNLWRIVKQEKLFGTKLFKENLFKIFKAALCCNVIKISNKKNQETNWFILLNK